MDVKLCSVYVISLITILYLGPHHALADGTDGESDIKGPIVTSSRVVSKVRACTVQRGLKGEKGYPGNPGNEGDPGEKGDKGEKGIRGEPGTTDVSKLSTEKGEKGDIGEAGKIGESGQKGNRGEQGDKGDFGIVGDHGNLGEKGDRGLQGVNGDVGEKGEKGRKGTKGERGSKGQAGPPGLPGLPAICPCQQDLPTSKHDANEGEPGNPLTAPCKNYLGKISDSDKPYYMGITERLLEVYCNMTSLETCIKGKSPIFKTFTGEIGPFWLSEIGINIMDTLQMREDQLFWLRSQSTSVSHKITYICVNSVPYSEDDPSKSVELLTWNDAVIGQTITDTSPLYYTVHPYTDNCSNAPEDKESSTVI